MKKIIVLVSIASLGGCAATPEEMAQLSASMQQLSQVGTNMQASAYQSMQTNTQIAQATAPAVRSADASQWGQPIQSGQKVNGGWLQKNADGTIVYCSQRGSTIICK